MIYRKGMRGNAVKRIQELLGVEADGNFGEVTRNAVMAFQREQGLKVDGIVGDNTIAKLEEVCGVSVKDGTAEVRRAKRTINEIIVHCSATIEGRDYTVADITKWHLARKFKTIGYHYVVYRDGSIHNGRCVDMAGEHAKGHNACSIGICYIGGLDAQGKGKDTRTNAQKAALEILLRRLRTFYPKARILGHRDTSPDINGNGMVDRWEWLKECPCFNAIKEYKNI